MGGADHYRIERSWRDPAEAVAFAREVVRRFGTGEVGFTVEISAAGGALLERLLPYLPEELRVEGRLAHAGDLVTDPDLLRAEYIDASQWLRESVGVQLAGPPGSGPQVGLAHPGRPFVPRGASSYGLTLNGKGLMSGDPRVRAFLSARLDACRGAGLLPGERDSDALLDALVAAWEAQLPSEETEEYSDAEIAGAPPPSVEVDGVILAYYGGVSRWRRWSVYEPTQLILPVGECTFQTLAGMDGLWLPDCGVDLQADLPTEAALVLGRREGCKVLVDLELTPSDEELAALLPHLVGGVARIEWYPISWLDAATGGYNHVTVWIGQDCSWSAKPGLIEVSIGVNYKTMDLKYGGSEKLAGFMAKEMGVSVSHQFRE